MSKLVTKTDFEWVCTEEPHATRRKLILEKYPQIKKLFGCDPRLKWVVIMLVFTQFAMLFVMKDRSWPVILVVGYCFGGVINEVLLIAIHEISHNIAFGHAKPLHNKLFAIFANLPVGLPTAISYRRYHMDHHKFQGDEVKDVDLPTELEAKLFNTTFGRIVWLFLQSLFYAGRPMLLCFKKPVFLEYVNGFIQISFDIVVIYFLGFRAFGYLLFGSFLAMGLHPCAAHFISNHFMFDKGFETYSYYGPFNWITFNVGYHNEHHDFPYISGFRLPEVRKIAPEFYDYLPYHTSWIAVLYNFIRDPNVGMYARIKRKHEVPRGSRLNINK